MAGYPDDYQRYTYTNQRPGRYRYQDEYATYAPAPGPPRYRPGPGGPNIIIENNNTFDEHPSAYYERPVPVPVAQPLYLPQQQQVIPIRGRSPSDLSYETRRDLDELVRMRHEREQEELIKQVEKDVALKEAKKRQDELDRKEEEKKLKKKAVEEWHIEEEKKKREAKEEEEKLEKFGKEYMRQQLRNDGYDEDEIDYMMRKKNKKDSSPARSAAIVLAKQPRHCVVHKKHIDPIILDRYGIEWDWAEKDGYIIIYRDVPYDEREILFEETRLLKEKKLIQFAEVEQVVVKGVQKDRNGRLVVVRKKSDRSRSKSPAVVTKKKFFI